MREILFKAKRVDNGEWAEGYYIKPWNTDCHYIVWFQAKNDEIEENIESVMYEIDPDTLCQYTGMTNKDGNKIWENDIIKFEWHGNEYIEDVHFVRAKFSVGFHITLDDILWSIEIIGNIFDSPELLELRV